MKYKSEDRVLGVGAPNHATVAEFWEWAFGDLCDDDIKGIYAEWVVTKILSIPSARRVSWANSDIITPEGVRIEIKSSAYWQSWKLVNEDGSLKQIDSAQLENIGRSSIRFSGLMAKDATGLNGSSKTGYKSDLYIFCFQHEENPSRWNALNLDQWEFFVFKVQQLQKFAGKSVSLKKLREYQPALNAIGLADEVSALVNEIQYEKNDHCK